MVTAVTVTVFLLLHPHIVRKAFKHWGSSRLEVPLLVLILAIKFQNYANLAAIWLKYLNFNKIRAAMFAKNLAATLPQLCRTN